MQKIITILIIFLANTNLFAQGTAKPFTLKGQLTGNKKDSVLLSYGNAEGKYVHAAAAIKNGTFSLSGHISGPEGANLLFRNKDEQLTEENAMRRGRQVFLEPAVMTVKGDPDKTETLTITGSATETDHQEYERLVRPAGRDSKQIERLTYAFLNNHPHSYYAEYLLMMYLPMFKLDSITKVYTAFDPALKENETGRSIAKKIESIDAGSPGKMAPSFKTTDINGKSLALEDFRGKYLILDFWASWCVPCRKSHPHLRRIYRQYKDKGLEIVGIASDEQQPDKWKAAVVKDSIGIWFHVLGGENMEMVMKGMDNPKDIPAKYGISALPTKLIIDPTGKILARFVGDGDNAESIDEKLTEIFGASAGDTPNNSGSSSAISGQGNCPERYRVKHLSLFLNRNQP